MYECDRLYWLKIIKVEKAYSFCKKFQVSPGSGHIAGFSTCAQSRAGCVYLSQRDYCSGLPEISRLPEILSSGGQICTTQEAKLSPCVAKILKRPIKNDTLRHRPIILGENGLSVNFVPINKRKMKRVLFSAAQYDSQGSNFQLKCYDNDTFPSTKLLGNKDLFQFVLMSPTNPQPLLDLISRFMLYPWLFEVLRFLKFGLLVGQLGNPCFSSNGTCLSY